jgi:hypothetical protein
MSLFKLLTNTAEGMAQAAIGGAKAAASAPFAVLDEGETAASGLRQAGEGLRKIGKAE